MAMGSKKGEKTATTGMFKIKMAVTAGAGSSKAITVLFQEQGAYKQQFVEMRGRISQQSNVMMVTRMMEMGAVRPAKSNPDFSAGEPGASGSVETESSAHSLSKLENSVMTGTTMTEMGVVASANRKMDLPARLCLANRCVS